MFISTKLCLRYFLLFLLSQARAKEEKELKKAKLDGRHEYLLGNIADVLNIEYNEVVEHILEGTQVCCYVHLFFLIKELTIDKFLFYFNNSFYSINVFLSM